MSEAVNHPSHYMHGKIEVAVAMDVLGDPSQWLGHALKYACRAPHKGKEVEDLRKAIWCAERAMELKARWPANLCAAALESLARALYTGIPLDGSDLRLALRPFVYTLVCRVDELDDAVRDLRKVLDQSESR